jgi:hypothetical protein
MRIFPIIQTFLFAANNPRQGNTWYLDGNNLLGYKGTPRDSDSVVRKLKQIEGSESVVLVFDGKEGQTTDISSEGFFKLVSLGEGISADDYIHQEVVNTVDPRLTRVQVVTGDRELGRRLLAIKPAVVREVINPLTFWRKYLPRLCGFKKNEEWQNDENLPDPRSIKSISR